MTNPDPHLVDKSFITNHDNVFSPMSKYVTFADSQEKSSLFSDQDDVATGKESEIDHKVLQVEVEKCR